MNYRQFGTTELTVSEIGFGAWAIGGDAKVGATAIGWGPADDATSIKAIRTALDAGINFFDTADIYGLGHSEALLGQALSGEKAIIATKVGNVARNEQFTFDYSASYILQACEASLKRLKREVIDYYQLHTARMAHLENGECIQAMEQLQQQGKIRYWGLSLNTFDPAPEADFLMDRHSGQGFQLVLNILNQKALTVMKQAAKAGYGIIARMPLQFGLLTGKFSANTHFSETDHRKNRLTPEVIERTEEALRPLETLCATYGLSRTQLALSYILSYTEVSTIIPGIRTSEHVQLNTTGLQTLEPDDIRYIESMAAEEWGGLIDLIKKQG